MVTNVSSSTVFCEGSTCALLAFVAVLLLSEAEGSRTRPSFPLEKRTENGTKPYFDWIKSLSGHTF